MRLLPPRVATRRASTSAPHAGSPASGAGEPWPALRRHLDAWVSRGRSAGLQVLVASRGRVIFEHAAGLADAARQQPVDHRTQFNLYSLTKPLTAALVVRLAAQGLIDLDAPIAQASGCNRLRRLGTVRETLLHRAGFANPLPLRWFHRAEEDARFDERDFVDRRLAEAAARERCSPRYSNIGYLALGRAIEQVTGLGFRAALHRHLIDTLDLGADERLGFEPAPGADWALGHLPRHSLLNLALGVLVPRNQIAAGAAGRWLRLRAHHVDGSAYGGLIGNARGLASFGMAMLGQRGGLDEVLRHRLNAAAPGSGEARTLAWSAGHLAGEPWRGHAGGGLGAYGELRLYPGIGAVSVLLTNAPGLRDRRALDALDAVWLRAQA